ncbi:transmembrane protein 201 isoform X1 [Anolis carolinensis]|uniref:transmembrane protein 201 isoform X1 n=1 Tax=Anolis carolinensis TaxID=28377 RepID=UPI002F2B4376
MKQRLCMLNHWEAKVSLSQPHTWNSCGAFPISKSRTLIQFSLSLPEYFSLLSGSCLPSPVPSPAPSVAGSVASSSGSLRYRRPLISPARLNLKGQRLMLFSAQNGVPSGEDFAPSESHGFASDVPAFPKRNHIEREMHDTRAVLEAGSLCSEGSAKKTDNSSHGSSCVVDTTTNGEESPGWKGRVGCWSVRGLLAVSLTLNAVFTSAFLYRSLR